jgi:4-hydroxy-3-methylbut-2-enyl diphosphate reductase
MIMAEQAVEEVKALAPNEVLVEEVLNRLREGYSLRTEEVVVAEEKIIFKLPAALTQPAA